MARKALSTKQAAKIRAQIDQAHLDYHAGVLFGLSYTPRYRLYSAPRAYQRTYVRLIAKGVLKMMGI